MLRYETYHIDQQLMEYNFIIMIWVFTALTPFCIIVAEKHGNAEAPGDEGTSPLRSSKRMRGVAPERSQLSPRKRRSVHTEEPVSARYMTFCMIPYSVYVCVRSECVSSECVRSECVRSECVRSECVRNECVRSGCVRSECEE